MADRRRINGPSGGTTAPTYAPPTATTDAPLEKRPTRHRRANEQRKIFLKTGLTPSASGSAYLELDPSPSPSAPNNTQQTSLIAPCSALKLACTVHGPRPLPRSAPFTPHILLSTHVKFAPFAARQRRGYVRDAGERDLAVHLETALRGVIIGDRWPKSGVEVVITVLEGEEDGWWGNDAAGGSGGWGMMTVLAGCITVASAAIADAGIDCVDLVAGGVAAIVDAPTTQASEGRQASQKLVLDPCPSEHERIVAACVVAHLPFRDEITELWFKGDLPSSRTRSGLTTNQPDTLTMENLLDRAVDAASGARTVLEEAVKEAAEFKLKQEKQVDANAKEKEASSDIDMGD